MTSVLSTCRSFTVAQRIVMFVALALLWPQFAGAALVWSTSGYTAGNVNGSGSSTDAAATTSFVTFQVTNSPTPGLGNFIGGSPAVSTTDFAAGGLLIDYAYDGAPNAATTTLMSDVFLQGVSFVIGDIDSNSSADKQDGVIVRGVDDMGNDVFPTITLAGTTQLTVTGTPGEVISDIAPNRGQDDTRAQATFDFGSAWVSTIEIEFRNYGTEMDDDNHWGVSDITWTAEGVAAVPEPSSAAYIALFGCLAMRRRRQ